LARNKILVYAIISIIFSASFLLLFFNLYFLSGGVIRFETYLIPSVYAVVCSLLFTVLLRGRTAKLTALLRSRSVKKAFQALKIAIPWAILLSSIQVYFSLNTSAFPIFGFVLLALTCFCAGVILVDLDLVMVDVWRLLYWAF